MNQIYYAEPEFNEKEALRKVLLEIAKDTFIKSKYILSDVKEIKFYYKEVAVFETAVTTHYNGEIGYERIVNDQAQKLVSYNDDLYLVNSNIPKRIIEWKKVNGSKI